MVKTIIFGIHGLGGHCEWFKNLEDDLKKQGISFYAFDLPGFGTNHGEQSESEFTKGHIDSYQDWINFSQKKYNELKANNPDARIVVLGHSLGALIASCMTGLDATSPLILSVPGFKGSSSTFNQSFFFSTLRKVVIDKLILQRDVYVKLPSSAKKSTPADADPLRISEVTQTMLLEIMKLRVASKKRMTEFEAPVFMIQIEDDKVVDNSTQQEYFELINVPNKVFKVYNDADHDWIWSRTCCQQVSQDIADWLS
ncbi:MAG: alpha/beta fold hydrolase [Candidatus Melainabacteria bacterium]|jgi:alpha-beta hydrolase superfamily lysophospholipase|nr:alpha/beta fold hydrolase [Candidatus Melainabacteria bacterium]